MFRLVFDLIWGYTVMESYIISALIKLTAKLPTDVLIVGVLASIIFGIWYVKKRVSVAFKALDILARVIQDQLEVDREFLRGGFSAMPKGNEIVAEADSCAKEKKKAQEDQRKANERLQISNRAHKAHSK